MPFLWLSEEAGRSLYDEHCLFEKLAHSLLMDAAKHAGEYLARSVHLDGKMVYRYNIIHDFEHLKNFRSLNLKSFQQWITDNQMGVCESISTLTEEEWAKIAKQPPNGESRRSQ